MELNLLNRVAHVMLPLIATLAIAPHAFGQANASDPGKNVNDPGKGEAALLLNNKGGSESKSVFAEITAEQQDKVDNFLDDIKYSMTNDQVKAHLKANNYTGLQPYLEVFAGLAEPAAEWYRKNPTAKREAYPYYNNPWSDPKIIEYVESIRKDPVKVSIAISALYLYGGGHLNAGVGLTLSEGSNPELHTNSLALAAKTMVQMFAYSGSEGDFPVLHSDATGMARHRFSGPGGATDRALIEGDALSGVKSGMRFMLRELFPKVKFPKIAAIPQNQPL